MHQLIVDLLEYARVTTATRAFEAVDLSVLCSEVLTDLEVTINEAGAKITVGALPTIEADATQMRQLMQNLISNSLKYRRAEVPPEIHVLACPTPASDLTCIAVQDNGIGVEPQHARKIFGVFQRLHGRGKYDGTGVGLAICQKIVERHNGEITVTSESGRGSTFTVTLPLSQPHDN